MAIANQLETNSQAPEVLAQIFRRTDETYGFTVYAGGFVDVGNVFEPGRAISFDSLEDCESAAKVAIDACRGRKTAEHQRKLDMEQWVDIKTVR